MVFPGTWTPPPSDSCKHGWHCHAPCEGSSLCLQTGGECHLPCSHGRLGARPGPGGSREVSESLPASPGSSWYFLRSMSQLEKKKKTWKSPSFKNDARGQRGRDCTRPRASWAELLLEDSMGLGARAPPPCTARTCPPEGREVPGANGRGWEHLWEHRACWTAH